MHCSEIVLAQAAKRRKPVYVASTSEGYAKSTSFPFREGGDIMLVVTSTSHWSYPCSGSDAAVV